MKNRRRRTLDIVLTKSLGLILEPLKVSLDRGLVECSPSLEFDVFVLAHFKLMNGLIDRGTRY
jgi:hypothetical protein